MRGVAGDLPGVRHAVVAFARQHGVPPRQAADIKLAVSEVVTNAVLHAFRGEGGPGTVTVRVDVPAGGGRVQVVVTDDGGGMAPRDDSPGLGLGLRIIAELADSVRVVAPPGGVGTEVRMSFVIDGVSPRANALAER
jgi:anti-sigma regulatory factor (Ser/Thr protein kinase)